MCLAPSLIMNPQARYFLYNRPSECSVYFKGRDYSNASILGCTQFWSYLNTQDVKKILTPLEIYDVYRNSVVHVGNRQFPLFVLCTCGRCLECRESYRKEIQARAVIEAAHSGTVIFYTLTYDDEHLPSYGLEKQHVVGAFKRLRTYIDRYLDFSVTFTNMYVGEYGSRTCRAHYHGIMFIQECLSPAQIFELQQLFEFRHKIFQSDEHRLFGVWPYAIRFDFQVARNCLGISKYVTKYITKQYLISTNPSLGINLSSLRHKTPMFVQLPKKIGLGCRYISEYAYSILNSTEPYLMVRALDGSVTKVRIPSIFVRKLIPPLSWYYPNACYTAHLVARLLEKFGNLIPSQYSKSLSERFLPYSYLCNFSLKKKQYMHLLRHIDYYEIFYFHYDWSDKVGNYYYVLDYLVTSLESACPDSTAYVDLVIKPKSEFINSKILPELTTEELLAQTRLDSLKSVSLCYQKLIFNAFDCVC